MDPDWLDRNGGLDAPATADLRRSDDVATDCRYSFLHPDDAVAGQRGIGGSPSAVVGHLDAYPFVLSVDADLDDVDASI